MRILHTADLHIGKTLNEVSLLEDQKAILGEITKIVIEKNVDCVLISGDVYQKSVPQAEAMTVFNAFVTGLVNAGKKVIVISGNHDSDQRIAYFGDLIRGAGVYVSECFDGTVQRVELTDEYGKVIFHLLPHLKAAQVRKRWPDEKITDIRDAVRLVLEKSPVDPSERNILLCHQFVTGAERSDSEEYSVGGLDNIDASLFDGYDYVAMGHIHKPQKLLRDTLRYAGSPLKYSFSEAKYGKSVVIADIREKGNIEVHTEELHPVHDMREVEGYIADILRMPYSEDYVSVTIHDENVPPDAKLDITAGVFPNMLRFSVENSKTRYTDDVIVTEQIENKSIGELFADFYRMQNNGVDPTEAHMDVLREICEKLEVEEE